MSYGWIVTKYSGEEEDLGVDSQDECESIDDAMQAISNEIGVNVKFESMEEIDDGQWMGEIITGGRNYDYKIEKL
jgi:hypothetical protein